MLCVPIHFIKYRIVFTAAKGMELYGARNVDLRACYIAMCLVQY